MIKVLFFIRTSKVKLIRESSLYAKVILENQFILISNGKNISSYHWKATNRLQGTLKTEKEKVLKQSPDLFVLKVERAFNDLSSMDNDIDLAELKEIISGGKKDNNVYLLSIFDKHNEDYKKRVIAGERSAASLQKCIR